MKATLPSALALSVGALLHGVRAEAQQIVDGQLWCGATPVALNDLAPLDTSAARVRAEEAARWLSLARRALSAATPERVPGHAALRARLREAQGGPARAQGGVDVPGVRVETLRALAHDACRALVAPRATEVPSLDALRRCLALLDVEGATLPPAPTPAPNAAPPTRPLRDQARREIDRISSTELTIATAEDDVRLRELLDAPPTRPPRSAMEITAADVRAVADKEASTLEHLRAFYADACRASPCPPVASPQMGPMVRAALSALGGRMAGSIVECAQLATADAQTDEGLLHAAFCGSPNTDACPPGGVCVLPSGQVQPAQVVASAGSRLPFAVFSAEVSPFAAARVRVTAGGQLVETLLQPGVIGAIDVPPGPRPDVARVTVLGRPNGRTLVVLASRTTPPDGGNGAASGSATAYLNSLMNRYARVSARRESFEELDDLNAAARSLARELLRHQGAIDQAEAAARAGSSAATVAQEKVTAIQNLLNESVLRWFAGYPGAGALRVLLRTRELIRQLDVQGSDWAGVASRIAGFVNSVAGLSPLANEAAALETWRGDLSGLQGQLALLCRFAASDYPIAVHDVILPGDAPAQVIDYDFGTGYQAGSTAESRYFSEDRPLYLRVANVPGNQVLSATLNQEQELVSNTGAVVGLRGPGDAGTSESGTDATEPDQSAPSSQFAGTRVVTIGRLSGGRRYTLTLKTRRAADPATAARTLAAHAIEVNGRFSFGAHVGVGASMSFPGAPVAVRETAAGSSWVTRDRAFDLQPSVPLMLVWYPHGRRVPEPGCYWGFGLGFDLAAPLKRYVLPAFAFGYGGFGVALGASLDIADVARVDEGVRVDGQTSTPNLVTLFGSRSLPRFGAVLAVTLDLDVFRLAFGKLFQNVPGT